MKYVVSTLSMLLLLLAGSALGQPNVTPPPGGWDECEGCYTYAYWTGPGAPAEWECNYDGCPADGECTAIQAATGIVNTDGTITVVIGDKYEVSNKKRIYIRLEGTGATGEPSLQDIQGINTEVDDASIGGAAGIVSTFNAGNWSIEIRGLIWPQPDEVIANIFVPGGGAVTITSAWTHTCCNYQSKPEISVPSITTWGAAILVALLLISGLYIMRRRKVTA